MNTSKSESMFKVLRIERLGFHWYQHIPSDGGNWRHGNRERRSHNLVGNLKFHSERRHWGVFLI